MSILLVLFALAAAQSAAPPISSEVPRGSFLRADDYRIGAVAYRLAVRGKEHCAVLLPQTGLFLHYLPEYDAAVQPEAVRLYGVDQGPGILSVIAGSPAARAGIVAGDVMLELNGSRLPNGQELTKAPKSWRAAVLAIETKLEDQLRAGPVRLKLLRRGTEVQVTLGSVPGCAVRSRLARSRQANAFADGRTAIMTTRMLGFVATDDELAVVLAHEAAHNILGHPGQLEMGKVPKGFLGNLGANAARVRETEEEADRLGIKLLWSAGYRTSAIIPFWQRLYRTFDPIPTPKFFNRHPSLAARKRIVEETLAKLDARNAAAQPGA